MTASAGDWLGGVWCRDVGVEREEAENQFQHLLFGEGVVAWQFGQSLPVKIRYLSIRQLWGL